MKIRVKVEEVKKKLLTHKAKLNKKKEQLIEEEKVWKAEMHTNLIAAYMEVVEAINAEIKAIGEGKNIFTNKSLIQVEYENRSIDHVKYNSRIRIASTMEASKIDANRWYRKRDKDQINEDIASINSFLETLDICAEDSMEVNTEDGGYFKVLLRSIDIRN